MGKGGKRGGPKGRPAHQPANPFETKTAKSKFATMGKRGKGTKKNVVKAKQEAVAKRKSTLLVEYRQLRKANTFIDRRFGEDDDRLDEEEKSLARLQKQRVKDSKRQSRGAKFALNDGDQDDDDGGGAQLTHLGRSLADPEDFEDDIPDLNDMDDGEAVQEMLAKYNFGGGEAEGTEGPGGVANVGADGKPKSKREVMAEIIAKSKMYKALKAKEREEDLEATKALDADWRQLATGNLLAQMFLPKGARKGLKAIPAADELERKYDVAARELLFDARGMAGERTLRPEEAAEKERQRLEALEKERVKRMRGEEEEDQEEELSGSGSSGDEAGKRWGKRKRTEQQSGDALGDDYRPSSEDGDDDDEEGAAGPSSPGGSGDEEEDETALDGRRKQRAAGNHPLQRSFREAAKGLLAKFGLDASNPLVADDDDDDDDDDEEEGSGEEDEEEEDGSEGDSSGSGGSEGEEEEKEEESGSGSEEEEEGATSSEEEGLGGKAVAAAREKAKAQQAQPAARWQPPGDAEPQPAGGKAAGKAAARQAGGKPLDGPLDLPYTIPVPASYAAFAALVAGRPAADLATAVQRIRSFNAKELATGNKRQMQVLYGILVQHYALLAGQAPLRMEELDVLVPVLVAMTAEVPYYAATVAQARIKRMHERFAAASSSAAAGGDAGSGSGSGGGGGGSEGAAAAPWSAARVLLQLQLFATLFPCSDRRHPVVTPAALLVGRYLTHMVVGTPEEAAAGLAFCSLAQHMAAPAKRFCPEVLAFCTHLLQALMPMPMPAAAARPRPAPLANGSGSHHHANGTGKANGTAGGPAAEAAGTKAAPVASEYAATRFARAALAFSSHRLRGTEPQALRLPDVLAACNRRAGAPGAPAGKEAGGAGRDDAYRLGLLRLLLCTVQRSAELHSQLDCFPEAFGPVTAALRAAAAALQLPPSLQPLCDEVLQLLEEAAMRAATTRAPLVRAGKGRAPPVVKEYNPRFEDDYVKGMDFDPDAERSRAKKLARALAKEKRGAMRELRKDSAFMAGERDRERARVDSERLESQRRFYSELQAQQGDIKSGGQAGMNPHLKKTKWAAEARGGGGGSKKKSK